MAYSARHVWVVGEVCTAANMNNNDSDLDYIPRQLDYVQITAPTSSITATTEGTAQAVITGTSQVYDTNPKFVQFWAYGCTRTGSGASPMTVVLLRGATVLTDCSVDIASATQNTLIYIPFLDQTPTAATYAYSVKAYVPGASATILAGVGGSAAQPPASLRITNALV